MAGDPGRGVCRQRHQRADVTTGSIATSLAIGAGNTIEGLLGAYLINRLSDGKATFDSPAGVTRFALLSFLPTALCATIGVTSLAAGGLVDQATVGSVWLTWWLGDLAGALLVTPVIVLWAATDLRRVSWPKLFESIVIFCVACIIGLIAFSPIFGATERRAPLGFLAVLPLLWSALRRGPRDTATSTLVLAGFAVWGTFAGSGPFGRDTLNESFLMLLTFMIGVTVPSLALSADAAVRRRTEDELRTVQDDLNRRVDSRTADLTGANRALQEEIDRRKRAEAVLDQQTRHLVEAQRLANLGSWMRNLETNEIVWSDQLYEIFGVQRGQEHSGSFDGYLQRIHPDDRERVRQQVQAAIKAGEDFRGERRIVRPNGEIRYVQTCVEVMKNDEGRVVGMHGICFDVTERKQAEIALERTREQLSQMQKMEALGQLTGGIAHDFNNLLMIVSGHAELLRRKLTDPNQLRAIEAIMGAGHRGERLTRQLLTFSRRQPLNPVSIDLSPAGAGAAPDAQQLAARQHHARHRSARRPMAGRGGYRRIRAGDGQRRGQCARCHARRRHLHDLGAQRARGPGRRRTPVGRSRGDIVLRHRHRHPARTPSRRSSIRSSPPRRSARAPASGCRRSTALPTSRVERSA